MAWSSSLLVIHSVICLQAAVCGLPSPSQSFHFVSEPRSWEDARSYCREKYNDLATAGNMEEMRRLQQSVDPKFNGDVWIGLKRSPQPHWVWSVSGSTTPLYRHWRPSQPSGNGFCVVSYGKDGWYDYSCTSEKWFLCYTENRSPKYELVRELVTWTEARSYCMKNYTDLAIVESQEDERQVLDIGEGQPIWIGLFNDPWEWIDQRRPSLRYWGVEPEMVSNGEDCAAMWTTDGGTWYTHMCNVTYPFVCQKAAAIKRQFVRLVVSTKEDVDLNDPNVKVAMLEQIKTKLKENGLSDDANLQWRENQKGKVFISQAEERRGGGEAEKRRRKTKAADDL